MSPPPNRPRCHPLLSPGRGLLWANLLACVALLPLQAQPRPDDETTVLDRLVVDSVTDDRLDPTGMGGPGAEMNQPPFSNDLLAGPRMDEDFSVELGNELQLATGTSPADLATGVNRVNLRGFPTPRLRNGFGQIGIPEILGVERVELIQGPLTPVAGRAAPGGIQNFITARPKGKNQTRLELYASSRRDRQARAENTLTLKPKKLWQRFAAGAQQRRGPENFTIARSHFVSGALTWRHNRAASTMFMLDYSSLAANPSVGVPEYRQSASDKIVGPYRPLAYFHTYGPNASVEKRLLSASIQFEGQIGRHVSVRANVQGLRRDLLEERFTTGQYLVDRGVFGGRREPQHTEQPLRAVSAGVETTVRFLAFNADHKATLLVESIHTGYTREQRALTTAERDALPLDVLTFDPDAPNYDRPAYDVARFRRILTDRHESTDFTAVMLGERAAFWQGRLVTSTGVRADFVNLDLHDNRPGAARPHVTDRVRDLTYHVGANYQLLGGRMLIFANNSTAFEPSTRIDARTGRIQGNETTLGYETGIKGLFFKRRLSATALLFRFYNQNISRRNPLYEDPIADAAQTQPQLVAAGEERFTGGTIDLKASLSARWTLSGSGTVTQAITTASPDLPEEIGRPLTRLPRTTVGATSRHVFPLSPTRNLTLSGTCTYVSGFVAYYESASRHYLAFPGNTLLSLNSGYSWKTGPKTKLRTHSLNASVRNLLDRDQLARLARPGQGREFGLSYAQTF
jgi:iron complex outermembrane recepter protein